MPVIGTFSPLESGYTGSLNTLTIKADVSILPNEHNAGRNAPPTVSRPTESSFQDAVARPLPAT